MDEIGFNKDLCDDHVYINKIIDLLYLECISSCGDGDAWWYVTHYSLDDVLNLIKQYNSKLKYPMSIRSEIDEIVWARDQECIFITNNKDKYLKFPIWAQMVIKT